MGGNRPNCGTRVKDPKETPLRQNFCKVRDTSLLRRQAAGWILTEMGSVQKVNIIQFVKYCKCLVRHLPLSKNNSGLWGGGGQRSVST